MKKNRISRHNGRAGKNGVYNASHNDRTATRADEKDQHIKQEFSQYNLCWSWNGEPDFKKAEHDFYELRYGKTIEKRNARYVEKGHKEKLTSVDAMLNNPKTCPEETILQIGDIDTQTALKSYFEDDLTARKAMGEILNTALKEYLQKVENSNFHVLTVAVHLDEVGGIHAHVRGVYDYLDEKGERKISQNKALEKMNIEPPEPDKPLGRFNNRKQTYDAKMRKSWIYCIQNALQAFKIKHPQHKKVAEMLENLELEPEPTRKNIEKNEYIIKKQKEQIAKNARMIEYQDVFKEFVKDAEEELERERGKKRERERGR